MRHRAVRERRDLRRRAAPEWVHHYNWHRPHEGLAGLCPIDRVCDRLGKTPIRAEVADTDDATKERVQIREHAVDLALRELK
jgi:hypothetical protein